MPPPLAFVEELIGKRCQVVVLNVWMDGQAFCKFTLKNRCPVDQRTQGSQDTALAATTLVNEHYDVQARTEMGRVYFPNPPARTAFALLLICGSFVTWRLSKYGHFEFAPKGTFHMAAHRAIQTLKATQSYHAPPTRIEEGQRNLWETRSTGSPILKIRGGRFRDLCAERVVACVQNEADRGQMDRELIQNQACAHVHGSHCQSVISKRNI